MPTSTFTAASTSDAMRIFRQGVTYPPTGGITRPMDAYCSTTRGLNAGNYQIYNGLIRWDTSSIPDGATITGATLRVAVAFGPYDGSGDRTIMIEWYAWDGVSSTDYSETPNNTAHTGTRCNLLTSGTYYDFVLINFASNVSTTSTTYLRLHTSGGTAATLNGADFAGIGAGYTAPQLIVTYASNPVPPDSIISSSGFTGSYTDAVTDDANWLIGV